MKNLRHLFSALVLTFVLTLPVFAGDIELPGVTTTPPPTASTTTPTTTSQNQTGAASTSTTTTTSPQSTSDPLVIQTLLNLLQGLLSRI